MRSRCGVPLRALAITLVLFGCGNSDGEATSTGTTGGTTTGTGGAEETPPAQANLVVGTDPCTTDVDCVPAECCHAAACVGSANAPNCADAMCTADCRFGTLDCGGACLCVDGRCAARLSEPPGPFLNPPPPPS